MALVASIWARPAAADPILFNIDGVGAPILTNFLDWAPGNTELQEHTGTTPTTATIVYQANLNSSYLNSPGDPNTQNQGDGGSFIKITALLTGTEIIPNSGIFSINPGGVINVYANNVGGNDLAGTGFNAGTLILTAVTNGVGFGSALLNDTPGAPTELLDQAGGVDNYNGTRTFQVLSGSVQNLQAIVTSTPNVFFPNIVPGQTLTFTSGSNTIPFLQVDPAAQFFNGSPGVAAGGICLAAPSPACINGALDTIMVQSDVATSFSNPSSPIPEPATLTLLGVGLLSASVARRRQQKGKK